MNRLLACAFALLAACGAPPDTTIHRAFVIGVDGLRPDALVAADTPHLDAWFERGILDLAASTHLEGDTVSGPGWASILTGVDVGAHGVTTNFDPDIDPAWPTFLQRAHAAGLSTAACYDWFGILPLLGDGGADVEDQGDDEAVGTALAERIGSGDFDVVFSQFDAVDHAGHATGFSATNPVYLDAIASVDANVAAALDAVAARPVDESWLVVLVTDHGGLGNDHTGPSPDTTTIPIAMIGAGFPAGGTGPDDANQMDVAPTVLDWLGVTYPPLAGHSWMPLSDR